MKKEGEEQAVGTYTWLIRNVDKSVVCVNRYASVLFKILPFCGCIEASCF